MYLTSIFLKVRGAQIEASVTGTLTSGMVGIPVTIEYDEAWEGLTKNLVCRCSKSGFDNEEYRSILNVGNTAVVAHEVMQAGAHLYLGLEGFRPDGELVIPTTWAMCGVIREGANTGEDLSADPTLPVWNQLQVQLEQLECGTFPQEQLEEIRACDIREKDFLDYAEDLLVIHGTTDEIIPYAESFTFADNNLIEFVSVEGADHRFRDPKKMETAMKAMFAFLEF